MKAGKRKALDKQSPLAQLQEQHEKAKASVKAKVEHAFRVLKCQFDPSFLKSVYFKKVSCSGSFCGLNP